MWAVSKDGEIGKAFFFSSLEYTGLHFHHLRAAGHFSSFSDLFSISLISALVYKHLVTVCQIQKEDINSSCFVTLTLYLSALSFLCLVISSVSPFWSPTTHSTASPIMSATFLFFPSVSSISSAACGSVSPL